MTKTMTNADDAFDIKKASNSSLIASIKSEKYHYGPVVTDTSALEFIAACQSELDERKQKNDITPPMHQEEQKHSFAEILKRSGIFRRRELALAAQDGSRAKGCTPQWIVMLDCDGETEGRYCLCRPVDAARLERMGFEIL